MHRVRYIAQELCMSVPLDIMGVEITPMKLNIDPVLVHQENVILPFLVLFTNSATMYAIWI
jgi:hypothetical protein